MAATAPIPFSDPINLKKYSFEYYKPVTTCYNSEILLLDETGIIIETIA